MIISTKRTRIKKTTENLTLTTEILRYLYQLDETVIKSKVRRSLLPNSSRLRSYPDKTFVRGGT